MIRPYEFIIEFHKYFPVLKNLIEFWKYLYEFGKNSIIQMDIFMVHPTLDEIKIDYEL